MDCSPSYQVDVTVEQLREFILETIDAKPEPSAWRKHVKQVNIALRPRVSLTDRTKDGQLDDPIASADLR